MNAMSYVPMLLKLEARAALKRNFPAALMISFLAALPELLMSTFLQMALIKATDVLNGLLVVTDRGVVGAQDLTALVPALREALGWYPQAILICLGVTVLTSFLSISQVSAELRLLRSQTITAGDALSRLDCFWKAIGLTLWRGLWLGLWGLAASGVSVLLMAGAIATRSIDLMMMAQSQGVIAMIILVGRAWLRYRLAPCVMADHPDMGPIRCLRESKRMVSGRFSRILLLILSFVLTYLVLSILSSLLSSLSQVVSLTVSLLLSLVLSLYIDTSVCALYEKRRAELETPDAFVKGDGTVSEAHEAGEDTDDTES